MSEESLSTDGQAGQMSIFFGTSEEPISIQAGITVFEVISTFLTPDQISQMRPHVNGIDVGQLEFDLYTRLSPGDRLSLESFNPTTEP